jgi:hypothetical protein
VIKSVNPNPVNIGFRPGISHQIGLPVSREDVLRGDARRLCVRFGGADSLNNAVRAENRRAR